jgi:hypothetical protein
MSPTARVFLSSLAVAGALTAQSQWLVGPGGFAQIQDVMPLVAQGDTVVVAPGTYLPFVCTRGVTIRAQTPGTVTVAYSVPQPCGCTCLGFGLHFARFDLPAGHSAHVIGVRFAAFWLVALPACPVVVHQGLGVVGGHATFEQCAIDFFTASYATVHLQDCAVTSQYWGAALTVAHASITVVGGSIQGCNAGAGHVGFAGFPAVSLVDGRLHACGVSVVGGTPSATQPGAPGIAGDGSLWLADAAVTAGAGCAVSVTGLVRIDRSTLNGAGAGCAVSPTGAPLVGIDRNGPITIGQLFQVTLTSEPNALLLVYGATRLSAPLDVPGLVEQPIWIDPTALFLADVAIAVPTGVTTFSYPVPAVPQLVGALFWLQGVGGTSFPLQTTPLVGGVTR